MLETHKKADVQLLAAAWSYDTRLPSQSIDFEKDELKDEVKYNWYTVYTHLIPEAPS